MPRSAILYESPCRSVLVVDIPASIMLSQQLPPLSAVGDDPVVCSSVTTATINTTAAYSSASANQCSCTSACLAYLSSAPAPVVPYPPPPEPRSAAARRRVEATVPAAQRAWLAEVDAAVTAALGVMRQELTGLRGGGPERNRLRNGDGDGMGRQKKEGKAEEGEERWMGGMTWAAGVEGQGEEFRWCLPRSGTDGNGDGNSDDHQGQSPSKRQPSHLQYHPPQHCPTDLASMPPLILSPDLNRLPSPAALTDTVVRNPWPVAAVIRLPAVSTTDAKPDYDSESSAPDYFHIPPFASFMQTRLWPGMSLPLPLPASQPAPHASRRFDFVLADPPWRNRSVRRSGWYEEEGKRGRVSGGDMGKDLGHLLAKVLTHHLVQCPEDIKSTASASSFSSSTTMGVAAIWITNSAHARTTALHALAAAGLDDVFEEWIWTKVTVHGELVVPVTSSWRKPYEILLLARRGTRSSRSNHAGENKASGSADSGGARMRSGIDGDDGHDNRERLQSQSPKRRVIFAVPDAHSRKPGLRELVGRFVFGWQHGREEQGQNYTALELYARGLTAGWCAVGDEVLAFNRCRGECSNNNNNKDSVAI